MKIINNNRRKVNLVRNSDMPRWRLFIMGLFLLAIFSLIIYRSAQLQLFNNDKACNIAKSQHEYKVELLPKRGNILDSNGDYLAMNVSAYSIYANPMSIDNSKKYAKQVSSIIDVNEKSILEKISKKSTFVWMKRLAGVEEKTKLEELNLEGIGFIEESKRVYPYGPLAGQILGFTNIDSKGIEGLEYLYNDYLAGEKRNLNIKKDGRGRIITDNPNVEKMDEQSYGNNITLTIDSQIQFIVENELTKGLENAKADSGYAIVLDSETGSVLAMASYPNMDPNNFAEYDSKYRKNLPIWKSFEPGSTLKPIVVAAALEENLVNPTTKVNCENGRRRVGNAIINDVHPYALLSVSDVITYSSNICASKIGEKLGKHKMYEYLEKFGFGQKTSIDLPGESRGLMRNTSQMHPVELATISFGQGVSVTGIQLATAYAAIANKGYVMKPHMIKKISDNKGKTIAEYKPEIVRRVISYDTANMVAQMLEQAVNHGTGKKAAIDMLRVAGKTGTAQIPDPINGGYYDDRYISSFAGFAPVDMPNITTVVVLENPKSGFYGGQVAAPIFREITNKILNYLEIVPIGTIADNVMMPDFKGKTRREILKWSQNEGVKVELTGNGFAVSQNPMPGERVDVAKVCSIKLEQNI